MRVTLVTLLALLLLALGITRAQSNRPSAVPGNPGKFQVLSAEYIHSGKNADYKKPGVFRLNTETGETWIYVDMTDDQGKGAKFWTPIE